MLSTRFILIALWAIALNTDALSISNQRQPTSMNLKVSGSRRDLFNKLAFGIGSAVVVATSGTTAAIAADKEPTIWKSGKTPIVPGQKPKDKNDTSGTRKDSSFLRSISNCKSQCETSTGSDGFARSKEECLSDCQDICCTTYEQCTFGIVPRA
mmetsp:Transcript_11610/g.17637  ORF Transcript_11610/g.17637 Transcript_11610/m.17637 type:complete len:154 (+) Transcript_11610:83-544(+)